MAAKLKFYFEVVREHTLAGAIKNSAGKYQREMSSKVLKEADAAKLNTRLAPLLADIVDNPGARVADILTEDDFEYLSSLLIRPPKA